MCMPNHIWKGAVAPQHASRITAAVLLPWERRGPPSSPGLAARPLLRQTPVALLRLSASREVSAWRMLALGA
jgi:hypothetical protein